MKSFKSILSLLILLGSSSLVASAQKTIISGHISTNDGKAASQVSIRIEGKNWGDISDINGNYQIDIPTAGKYILHLTALGIQDQVKDVIINKGEHIKANFEIELTYDQLADVTVLSNQNQLGNKITYPILQLQAP